MDFVMLVRLCNIACPHFMCVYWNGNQLFLFLEINLWKLPAQPIYVDKHYIAYALSPNTLHKRRGDVSLI